MPSRLERWYGEGHLHFITASCYRRQKLLASAQRCDIFEQMLEEVRRRFEFVVLGYVVMPEHFHLLISEPMIDTVSVVMQALKVGTVQRLWPSTRGRRAERASQPQRAAVRLWQHRFYDFNVWTAEKRIEKLRYLHRNPVRRGLVEHPEDWKWSSYRAYAFREQGTVTINDWSIVRLQLKRKERCQFDEPHPPLPAKTAGNGAPLIVATEE